MAAVILASAAAIALNAPRGYMGFVVRDERTALQLLGKAFSALYDDLKQTPFFYKNSSLGVDVTYVDKKGKKKTETHDYQIFFKQYKSEGLLFIDCSDLDEYMVAYYIQRQIHNSQEEVRL
jgi:hypothetical protein